jgi:cyclopropane fatty-acyl-phospholipid synthase-like methyltransferase
MTISKKYGHDYWDGNRKFGYGGYKYIPGRWEQVAKKFIKKYKLNNQSKILDLGCGKGFLLFEIRKILPKIQITGIDISNYGLKNSNGLFPVKIIWSSVVETHNKMNCW